MTDKKPSAERIPYWHPHLHPIATPDHQFCHICGERLTDKARNVP